MYTIGGRWSSPVLAAPKSSHEQPVLCARSPCLRDPLLSPLLCDAGSPPNPLRSLRLFLRRDYFLRATIAGSTRNTGITIVADGLWHYLCVSWQPLKHLLTVVVDADQVCAKDRNVGVGATEDDDSPDTAAETADDRMCKSSALIT